jgi:hypothetical protein
MRACVCLEPDLCKCVTRTSEVCHIVRHITQWPICDLKGKSRTVFCVYIRLILIINNDKFIKNMNFCFVNYIVWFLCCQSFIPRVPRIINNINGTLQK